MLDASARQSTLATLTEREFQVLSLLKEGQSYQSIAGTPAMKYRTVINVCSTIRQKLGAKTLADLVRRSLTLGS